MPSQSFTLNTSPRRRQWIVAVFILSNLFIFGVLLEQVRKANEITVFIKKDVEVEDMDAPVVIVSVNASGNESVVPSESNTDVASDSESIGQVPTVCNGCSTDFYLLQNQSNPITCYCRRTVNGYVDTDLRANETSIATAIQSKSTTDGLPLFTAKNMCRNSTHLLFVASTEELKQQALDCCSRSSKNLANCPKNLKGCSKIRNYRLEVGAITVDEMARLNATLVPGNTWVADTGVVHEHFGHFVSQILQIFSANHNTDVPTLDAVMFPRQSGPPEIPSIKLIWDMVDSVVPAKVLYEQDIGSISCFENLLEANSYEQMFYTRPAVRSWHALLEQNGFPRITSVCNDEAVNVAILQRVEGLNLRRILNYDVLEKVLKRFNITSYRNVTVGESMTIKEQAEVFQSFNFLITPHSSQLKNLIFARPGTAVIEAKPVMFAPAFSHGVSNHDVFYLHSFGHTGEAECMATAHKQILCDYYLNEEVLAEAVRFQLSQRKQYCKKE